MNHNNCLYCYDALQNGETDFHARCSRQFFGTDTPPVLEYALADMDKLAATTINQRITVPGVQPKLSVDIFPNENDPKTSRLTLVGLWGHYILKPPAPQFPHLPENEAITMHLAIHFGIPVADHSLIRLGSGELAYITKRFDRVGRQKLAMEDMCQLTETLTINKYRSSMEKIGKKIWEHATHPGLDAARFFEVLLFCFLTGNADMHLKNFSLLTSAEGAIALSPAYDLLCTPLAMPEDDEEMALTLNGKKNKLEQKDFGVLAASLKLPAARIRTIYKRFAGALDDAGKIIDRSFLPDVQKKEYKNILLARAIRLGLKNSSTT